VKKRGIKDLSWGEVARLDIGAWKGRKYAGQRVPRMTEMCRILHAHPERRLYIDIKNIDITQLAREVHQAGVGAQPILASTDYAVIRDWKRLAPESFTLHWLGGAGNALAARIAALRETDFDSITQLQIHVRFTNGVMTPSAAFLLKAGAELRAHDILFQILPWDRNDPAVFRRLMELGAASFATNYPDIAIKTTASITPNGADARRPQNGDPDAV